MEEKFYPSNLVRWLKQTFNFHSLRSVGTVPDRPDCRTYVHRVGFQRFPETLPASPHLPEIVSMQKTPNPFEEAPETNASDAVVEDKFRNRRGNPFEAPSEDEADDEATTLVGRAENAAPGTHDPKPLLSERTDDDLVEWMMGVGRFFAAAGVALCRGAQTPELVRSRNRALRWAMGFDVLDEALRRELAAYLAQDDRFEAAPAPELLEASRVLADEGRRSAAEAVYTTYGFSAGEDFAPDHLGRQMLFYGLMLERLHACAAAHEREAVDVLFRDAVDFLAEHLDWIDRISPDHFGESTRLLLRTIRAVAATERSLTIS